MTGTGVSKVDPNDRSEKDIRDEAKAVAGPDVRTDGGENTHTSAVNETLSNAEDGIIPLRPGDHVQVPDGDEAVVVADPSKSAGGYLVEGRMTVADYADVDPTEPVYEVAFIDTDDDALEEIDPHGYARSHLELVRRLGGGE